LPCYQLLPQSPPPITPPISPTPIPSPIPTPATNHPPVITTSSLPLARIFKPYLAFISGYDRDWKDYLTMEVINLPPKIKVTSCYNLQFAKIKYITCRLEGTPTVKGNFNILVILHDNRGLMDRKVLPLKIF